MVKCVNIKTNQYYAIKIIKNKLEYTIQGLIEIKILDKLLSDPNLSQYEK